MTRKMQNPQDQFEEKKVLGKLSSKLKDRQFSPELMQGSNFRWREIRREVEVKSKVNNGSGIETPQSDLAALKQSLIENYIATGWPEPPLHSLLPCACGWIVHMWQQWFWEMRSRDSRDVLGVGQGTAAKIWIQDGEVSARLEDAVWGNTSYLCSPRLLGNFLNNEKLI